MPWLCLLLLGTVPAAKSDDTPRPGRAVHGLRLQLMKKRSVITSGGPTVMLLRLVNEGERPVGVVLRRDAYPEAFVEVTLKDAAGQPVALPQPETRRPERSDLQRLEVGAWLEREVTLPLMAGGKHTMTAVFHQHPRSLKGEGLAVWDGDVASNTLTLHVIHVKTTPKR